jgi:hypothetical protein
MGNRTGGVRPLALGATHVPLNGPLLTHLQCRALAARHEAEDLPLRRCTVWQPLERVQHHRRHHQCKASPKLVKGAQMHGWNAAYGALSIAFPCRLEPVL